MGYVREIYAVETMQKGKAPSGVPSSSYSSSASSPSQRLLPRRWRNKNKAATSTGPPAHPAQAMWSSEGPCTWCSVSGRKVVLKSVSILHLSEAERLALQKLASSKLQAMDLACPIVIPKDATDLRRQKKRALSLKRKSKSANLTSLLDSLAADKDIKPAGLVFGIPLSRVIANDRELVKKGGRTPVVTLLHSRSGSADHLLSPRQGRKSSSSSQGSLDNGTQNGTLATANSSAIYDSAKRAASSDSLSESDSRNNTNTPTSTTTNTTTTSSSLIDALSLHTPTEESSESDSAYPAPQVPHVVDCCFKHLETYGLNVVGIFRVGSSKKRVKQLREEFDTGKDVRLTDEQSVHDVGALLKEFFRDLPEPLLTRDLYLPLVATRKLKDRAEQAEAVSLLLTLLPASNRDTLWALLCFLATVHRHSQDTVDDSGQEVQGNKMDSNNLATLFGPNLLHRARAVSEKQFMVECVEQAEQSSEVIGVIKDMIDNHHDLFEISASQHDEVLKLMMETDQENLDHVLRRLSNENQIEQDPESTSSVFETEGEVTPQTLQHSANSDADLLCLARKKGVVHHHHRPLRLSRSADPWTETDPAKDAEHRTEKKRLGSEDGILDQPSPRSPCPPQDTCIAGPHSLLYPAPRTDTMTLPRAPLVTVSNEDAEVVLRPGTARRRRRGQETVSSVTPRPQPAPGGSGMRERPFSDTAGTLGLPPQPYSRDSTSSSNPSSGGSSSSHLSSSGGSATTAEGCCGHWETPATIITNTPTTTTDSSSLLPNTGTVGQSAGRRRRPILKSSSRSDDDDGVVPPVGSPEWQRERWRHWEQITADRKGGAGEGEQETLV